MPRPAQCPTGWCHCDSCEFWENGDCRAKQYIDLRTWIIESQRRGDRFSVLVKDEMTGLVVKINMNPDFIAGVFGYGVVYSRGLSKGTF